MEYRTLPVWHRVNTIYCSLLNDLHSFPIYKLIKEIAFSRYNYSDIMQSIED